MKHRLLVLDLYRGIGIILMILFHLIYDLDYFHFITLDTANTPLWIHLRTFIVALFMSAVGMSLYLVYTQTFNRQKYIKRLLLLSAASAAISVVSYIMFADNWIYFGVLHMILVASVIGPFFTRLPNFSGMLGEWILGL